MEDLIRRSDAIEAIEVVDWYHQNRNKDMVSGANSDEHQAWYKADDVYKALEAVPSAESTGDLDNAICEYVKEGLMANPYDRPQGEWIYCEDYVGHDGYKCSECGFFVPWCYDAYADSNFIRHYHTCPHCDSRMKGADDDFCSYGERSE